MPIEGFDWDDGNKAKCQKHGLSIGEIEQFFQANNYSTFFDASHSDTEQRYLAIGQLETGRYVLAAFTIRVIDQSLAIRPISVRPMHKKEVLHYENRPQKTTEPKK